MSRLRSWRRLLLALVLVVIFVPAASGLARRDLTDQPTNQPFTVSTPPDATTSVASGTPTVTLTVSPTASGTPAVTLTPTFAPTAPAPTPSPAPPATGQVQLTLDAAPADVHPGDVVTYTLHLTNAGAVRASRLTISDTLPAGLVYVPDSAGSGQYAPAPRRLTWSLEGLDSGAETTFNFQARVRGDVLDDLVVNRVEVTGENLQRAQQTQATVAVIRQALIPPEGGVLETPNGRLRVAFPPGAVAGPVTARFATRSIERLAARQAGLAFTFDLQATDPAGQRVTRFARPLTITLQLDGLVNWTSRPDFLRPWVTSQDETTGRWVSITPAWLDEQAGTVTFTTDHFSLFGAGTTGVKESGWLLNFNDTRVNRFSGGLTWGYDFDLPPGPGGVQPGLRLSYNSRRLDGVLTWGQSDGVGWGWNLDRVEVLWRNVHRCTDGANYFLCWDATPLLVLNGEALKLVPETILPANVQYLGHSSTYRFRTEDDRLWRVRWRTGQTGVDGWQPEADGWDGNGYWEVTLGDGTRYLLGTTPDSRQTLQGNIGGVTTPVANRATVRWRLKRLVYPTGVSVDYAYEDQTYEQQCTLWATDDQFPSGESCDYGSEQDSERASYLTQIDYPGARVSLDWQPRWNGNGPNDGIAPHAYRWDFNELNGLRAIFWQTDALQKVVLEREKPDGTWSPVQEWHLTYATYIPQDESNKQLRILEKLQPWSPQGNDLPAFTFGYTGYQNKDECSGTCSAWDQARFYYPRLTSLDNGYGGVITATYATLDGGGVGGHTLAKNYRVTQRTVNDGQGGGYQALYAYSDGNRGRCYLESEDATQCKWPDQFDYQTTGGRFLGYREVTTTFQSLVGTPFKQTYARFALPDDRPGEPDDPWPVRGRSKVETAGEAGATPMRQITHTWAISATLGGANFVSLAQQATTTDGHTTRTDYSYDAYGNLTRVIEYGNVNVAGDERTTHYLYYPQDDGQTYIVDRVARETLYAGEHPNDDNDLNTLQARTRYHYDLVDPNDPLSDPRAWDSAPTAGLLTQVDAWNGGLTGTDSDYSITGYRYDDWGNRERVTDPLTRTTTTDYDTLFHTYPITQTNPLEQTTIIQYYGVNGAPATGEDAFFGQIESVTDPNSATTRYTYDEFGRLTQVFRPDDTGANDTPSVVHAYYDDNLEPQTPFMRATWRKQAAGAQAWSTGGTFERRFYDGLGRLIQVQTPYQDWQGGGVGQRVVRFTQYDAQGQVAAESVPYLAPAYVYDPDCNGTGRTCNPHLTPDSNKPQTTYAYDALGQQTTLTHPDGRSVQTDYDGWRTTMVDENSHQTAQEQDAYGRLVKVEEYAGADPYSLYATTTYTYSVQDNLTGVLDATGHTTDIEYDPLGRKTGMDDPDMGQWAYAYDAAGNLVKQRDARDQAICFYYDSLDRLVGKTYHPNVTDLDTLTCPGAPYTVRYTYDQGANGLGRRTGMTDGSGRTAWGYDARGRAVTETQTIGPLGTYTTTYSYNSANQVVSTTYPDSEVVTTTYNIAGQPAALSSSLEGNAIGQMSYNAQGQPKTLQYGDTLVTHYGYYGYNGWGIGDADDAPDQSWANQHVGQLWKLCTVPAGVACPQAGSGSSVLDLRYGYDAVGNITGLRDKTGGADELQSFTYDALDRLAGASGPYNRSYSYNAIGNMTYRSDVGTYSYSSGRPHAVTAAGSHSYGYDANGNMTGRDGDSLTYDAENRLQSVTSAGETVTYTYDGDGRRVLRDTDTETVAYVGPHYELRFDKQPMAEDLDDDCTVTVIDIMRVAAQWGTADPLADVNDDGTVDVNDVQQVAGRWRETCHVLAGTTKYYTLGGRRVAMRKGPAGQAGTLYYLFADHLGSTSVSYRSDGGDTRTQRYYPWGTIQPGPASTLPTDRTFTGQQLDANVGLMYYSDGTSYGRFYEPALGRWSQPDSIIPNYGDPQSLNRYTYVNNRPVVLTDPNGRCPWCIGAAVGGIIGGGSSWVKQTIQNREQGMSWREAALTVNIGEIAGATVGGAIIGGTFGAAGAAGGLAGLGFWGTVGVGGVSSAAAGQASPLIAASVNEAIDWLKGRSDFSRAEVLQTAQAAGFLDPQQITIDTTSGMIGGAVAYPVSSALTQAARNFGLLDTTIQVDPIWTVQYLPNSRSLIAYTGRTAITIPRDVYNAYLIILTKEGPDRAARWLFNQVRTHAGEYLEEQTDAAKP